MSICDTCFTRHKCAKYARGKRESGNFCIKQFKLGMLYKETLLSEKQREHMNLRIDSDGTDRTEFQYLNDLQRNIETFVDSGDNLYIYSTRCGNGKTSWSLRLIQEYLNRIWYKSDIRCRALFINVPKFLLMLKDNISNKNDYIAHIKENVNDCDIVVWDDIGTKVGTEFELENLLSIINSRIDSGKSNIYTSNMSPEQLRQRVGERLYSRIVQYSKTIQLNGSDKRGLNNR